MGDDLATNTVLLETSKDNIKRVKVCLKKQKYLHYILSILLHRNCYIITTVFMNSGVLAGGGDAYSIGVNMNLMVMKAYYTELEFVTWLVCKQQRWWSDLLK